MKRNFPLYQDINVKYPLLLYFIKFLGTFFILYFGTMAIIGIAAPGGYYSAFVHDHLNYPAQLRNTLLYGSKFLLSVCGYHSYVHGAHYLRMPGGRGVRMVYSCLGIGIMSFWTAFIFANKGAFKKKLAWITGGLLVIWLINITRVALLLLAANKNWPMPFNLDNHTLFNIAAYAAIFIMIFCFDRSQKKLTDVRGTGAVK